MSKFPILPDAFNHDSLLFLKDAATGAEWGTLTRDVPGEGHWMLQVGDVCLDTLTGARDTAFFFAAGFRMGQDNLPVS